MSQMPLSPTIKQNSSRDRKSNSIETLEVHLKRSFSENKDLWSETYPGLTLDYLSNHFYDLSGNRFARSLFFDQWFGGEIALKWKQYKAMLDMGRPLSYISKSGYFFETEFFVDERVLIPRFETEVLLEQVLIELKELDKNNTTPCRTLSLAEVGVGPGTLSLSLAQSKYVHSLHIDAGDFSDQALEVCSLNLFRLGFVIPKENKVELLKSDRLANFSQKYDIIFSNPPYIKRQADLSGVHKQVLENEPEVALFLEDESYDEWFACLFRQVGEKLKKGSVFLMEGHEDHLDDQLKQIQLTFPCVGEVIKDLTGRNRILKVRKI